MPENLIISDGLTRGRKWGTYRQGPKGDLHRVVSPYLPLRETRQEALGDLRAWLNKHIGQSCQADAQPYIAQLEALNAREAGLR